MAGIINTSKTNRLYKGKSVFKWEDNPGLGHHCGVCAKPFTKDSCKVTCLGKHAEPCYRYHQILHFLGKSHECSPCVMSDQMHHSRHKEILALVRRIKEIDDAEMMRLAPYARKQEDDSPTGNRRRRSIAETTTETSSDLVSETPRLNKRERKKQRRSGVGTTPGITAAAIYSKDDMEFIDEAIHFFPADERALATLEDNIEHQTRQESGDEEYEFVKNSKKPTTPSSNSKNPSVIRHTTSAFIARTSRYRNFGKSQRSTKRSLDIYDGVDPEIFMRLGVDVNTDSHHDGKRKELVVKLVEAVKNDLDVILHEEDEAKFREIAFFRWAGRSVRLAMDAAHESYDWSTGMLSKNFEIPELELVDLGEPIDHQTDIQEPEVEEDLLEVEPQLEEEEIKVVETTTTQSVIPSTPKPSTPKIPGKKRTAAVLKITSIPKKETTQESSWSVIPRKSKTKKRLAMQKENSYESVSEEEDAFDRDDLNFLIKMRSSRT